MPYVWNVILVLAVSAVLLISMEFIAGVLRDKYYMPDPHPMLAKMFNRNLPLDKYEVSSGQFVGHWNLKKGYQRRDEGGGHVISINKHGFRGEDIASVLPDDGRFIIVGDSVIFGTGLYALSDAVKQAFVSCDVDADLINAGVEGYSTRNVWAALEDYSAVKPTTAVIYIGWNDIYSEQPISKSIRLLSDTRWLFEKAKRGLLAMTGSQDMRAHDLRARVHIPNMSDPMRKNLTSKIQRIAMRIKRIVDAFHKKDIDVVLVTLMGLVDEENIHDPKIQKIAHLPFYTQNPYLLIDAKRYLNVEIKKISKELKVDFVDLDEYVSKSMPNKADYFTDSVHLNNKGLRIAGYSMGKSLVEKTYGRACHVDITKFDKTSD